MELTLFIFARFFIPMNEQKVKRRGTLVFKGGSGSSRSSLRKPGITSAASPPSSSSSMEYIKGDGRIVCSAVTVQGMETRFKEQLVVGDVIQIHHPQTLLSERRNVTGILSQRSLTVDFPFSSDFVSTIEYSIGKRHKDKQETTGSSVKKEEESGTLVEASRDYPGGSVHSTGEPDVERVLTYREKVGMSYRTVAIKVDKDMSKEDLLDLQTKKSHDRYC